jgi:hypothetical protein
MAAILNVRAMPFGEKTTSGDSVPAFTLTKSSIAAGLPEMAASNCCVSGGGGLRVAALSSGWFGCLGDCQMAASVWRRLHFQCR